MSKDELNKRIAQLEAKSSLLENFLFILITQQGPESIDAFLKNMDRLSTSYDDPESDYAKASETFKDDMRWMLEATLQYHRGEGVFKK